MVSWRGARSVAGAATLRHALDVEGTMSDQRRDYAVLISLMMREEAEVAVAAACGRLEMFLGNSSLARAEQFYR